MNTLHVPTPQPLSGRTLPVPYVLVGDEAFQLSENLMKPFSGLHVKGSKERVFNYRLCRARRVSENAFGILSSSFRVLRKSMLLNPDVATTVTLATIHLHNYLRKTPSRTVYCPSEMFDKECTDSGDVVPGLWRHDSAASQLSNIPRLPRRSSSEAQKLRNEFAEYFCTPQGELHFQYNK
uniref:DDE Tnp4 domain-containing protein n=1 Tax=Cacopsylla melanoneura TaxID=428564 RepID=A0A8D8QWB5_9HEMI